MKELNYRFKSIEEKIINGKEVHKAQDIFDSKDVYVEKYREVKDMDWEETSKTEEELNKFKDDGSINDFFYTNDYERDIKIFYKVFETYDNFDTTVIAGANSNIRPDTKDSNIRPDTRNSDIYSEDKEEINKISDIDKGLSDKPENPDGDDNKKEDNKKKVYKINELGGSVKVKIVPQKKQSEPVKEEDIFTSPLLNTTIETADNTNLELNYKKTASRAEMNNKIICKICEQPINKERIDIENNIAYCEHCHAIRQIKKLNEEEKAKKAISIVAPEGIRVEDTGSKLHIEARLNITSGIVSLIVAIVFIVMGVSGSSSSNNDFGVLIFAALSLFLGYSGLIDLINKIYIDVTKQSIIIHSGPLPHFPMKTFHSDRISQIYVKEYVHKNKNNTTYSYKVRAILKNGKDKVLVKLDKVDYALYLERSIESWLGIEDRHVTGEYK